MKKLSFILAVPILLAGTLSRAQEVHTPAFTDQIEGHGKPVILIPGLGCSAEVWNGTVKHLTAQGFETHALTLAGFGGVAPIHTADYLKTVRDDLASYIQQNKLDHPVIIGHSLGGFVALWLAAAYPNLPSKVVSVDGLPYLAAIMNPAITPEGAANMAAGIKKGIESGSAESFESNERATLATMITSPPNIDRELKVAMTSDRVTMGEAMAELMTTDIRPEMAKIKVPLLVLATWVAYKDYGVTHDSALAADEKEFAADPATKIVENDTSRHFIQLDAPDWFYSQLDTFLK